MPFDFAEFADVALTADEAGTAATVAGGAADVADAGDAVQLAGPGFDASQGLGGDSAQLAADGSSADGAVQLSGPESVSSGASGMTAADAAKQGALYKSIWDSATALGSGLVAGGKLSAADKQSTAAAGVANTQADLANRQWQRYLQVFAPVEDQAATDATNYDSPDRLATVMGQAHGTNSQAFDLANNNAIERLRQYGVNPSSDRMLELNNSLASKEATSDASLQTTAANTLHDNAIQARLSVANLGRNMPAQASTGLAAATSGLAGLSNQNFNQGVTTAKAVGSAVQPLSTGLRDWVGSSPSTSSGTTSTGSGQDGYSSLYADGGPVKPAGGLVRGPGTGTSDSIPAVGSKGEPIRIANGEYIIPADVVRHKGVEFFDRIVQKHHTPVHVPTGSWNTSDHLGVRRA